MASQSPPSIIERQIEVLRVSDQRPDDFKSSSPFWRPGERGIFGGFAIAQSLRAAQQTVRKQFVAHSLHGSFLHAASSENPIYYHVERLRDGKGFCTRSVRAVQGAKPIFVCTISFTKERSPGNGIEKLQHQSPMPPNMPEPKDTQTGGQNLATPFVNSSVGILDEGGQRRPEDKRIHQWIKANGPMSSSASLEVHQAAIAFMSDSYFLVGVPHSHEIWHFVTTPISEFYPTPEAHSGSTGRHTAIRRPHLESPRVEASHDSKITMMVSLDHTIYFHNMEYLRADEWLLSEISCSWTGNGRGLVRQQIWTKDGVLVASCIQEVSFKPGFFLG